MTYILQIVTENIQCTECLIGNLVATGGIKYTNPLQYTYKCDNTNCNNVVNFTKRCACVDCNELEAYHSKNIIK